MITVAAGGVSNKLSKGAIIGIGVGAAFGVMLIALLAFLAIKQKRKVEAERKKNPFGKFLFSLLADNQFL